MQENYGLLTDQYDIQNELRNTLEHMKGNDFLILQKFFTEEAKCDGSPCDSETIYSADRVIFQTVELRDVRRTSATPKLNDFRDSFLSKMINEINSYFQRVNLRISEFSIKKISKDCSGS